MIPVIHLVEDLKLGGLETILASIATGLDKTNYHVSVWCLSKGGVIADELRSKGIDVRILGMSSYYNVFNIIRLAKLLRVSKTRILHTHAYFANTFGRIAAVLARTPVVLAHVHTTDYRLTARNRLIEKCLAVVTDRIICISEAVQRFVVEEELIPKDKTRVIYNGISPPPLLEMKPDRKKFGLDDASIILITVASLVPNKGHRILLDALKTVSMNYPHIRLLIIGDGPDRVELERRTHELGLSSTVRFTGQQRNIYPFIGVSDIFILASLFREGLSIAIIEAMAMGKPVIASDLGGIPEVVQNGVSGLLTPPGNSEAIAEAIETLISNPLLRERMGREGRAIYIEKFTLSRMIQTIERLYHETVQKNCR